MPSARDDRYTIRDARDSDRDFKNWDWIESLLSDRILCACWNVLDSQRLQQRGIDLIAVPKKFFVYHPGPIIVRADLVDELAPHCDRAVRIPISVKGQAILTHVALVFPPEQRMVLRGGHRARYRVCRQCQSVYCEYHGDPDRTDLIARPDEEIPEVLYDRSVGMLVSNALAEKLRLQFKPHITAHRLNMARSPCPQDGCRLPGDPDWREICPDFRPARDGILWC